MAGALGIMLVLAGGGLAAIAAVRPIDVGSVVNLGLMCDRICLLICAGTLWIMGAVLVAAEYIRAAIREYRRRRDW